MSDFDAQGVLRKVDEGLTPSSWTIVRARKGYFYEQGFTYAIIALMIAGLGVVMGFITALQPSPSDNYLPNTPSSHSDVWLFAGIAIFALLFAFALAWDALYQFSQLRTVGTHVFVLTPNGCVARTGPKPYQTSNLWRRLCPGSSNCHVRAARSLRDNHIAHSDLYT